MTRNNKLMACLLLMVIALPCASAWVITGQVTGQGTPISGAQVSILKVPGNILETSGTTDGSGAYSLTITDETAPLYTIKVDSIGVYAGDSNTTPLSTDSTVKFDLVPVATVSLSGYVKNTTDPLNNAVVKVKQGSSLIKSVNTNSAGYYSTSVGDTLNYTMVVSLASYSNQERNISASGSALLENFTLYMLCPDSDGDGYDDSACGGTDCNDTDASLFTELTGYADKDSDGFTILTAETFCTGGSLPANYSASATAGDCNDNNAGIYPGASEVHCNNVDEDCSGSDYCVVDDDDDDDGSSHSSGGGILYSSEDECSENWICDDWTPEECPQSEEQTRTCEDINACDTDERKPDETRTCNYIAPEPEPEIDGDSGDDSGMDDITGAVVGTDQKSSLWPLLGMILIIAGLIGIAGLVMYIRKK
ncbi:hypothetical protein GF345_03640 [Candidatus Woesearchaeota archaeon]|nr:hypothetical protein [Candidatus Woesearchaeota archaeon]